MRASHIERRIMGEVYRTYCWRKLFSFPMFSLITMCMAVISLVSFENVWKNMPHTYNMSQTTNFFLTAFAETSILVQLLVAGLLLAFSLVFFDIIRKNIYTD